MDAFDRLSLREQHERLQKLRAIVVLLVSGDVDTVNRLIGDIIAPDDPLPDGDGLADAVDAWLQGGAQ